MLIDTDVHQGLDARFKDYLAEPWKHMALPSGFSWPAAALGHTGYREDIGPKGGSGLAKDSDPQTLINELLNPYGMTAAILNGSRILGAQLHPNSRFALAYAQAYNDWLIDHWLEQDPRFWGSLLVAPQDIAGSVKEIHRVGPHRKMVQIMMSGASPMLFGKPYFWPLYQAAVEHNLPVAVHILGLSAPTGSGWGSTYLENHTLLSTGYMDHLVSLICEGVFERFPDLKFVFIEGGVAVFAPLLWRLDKNWKGVRAEVPWLTRRPSEYVATNVRFTTQPIEEPEKKHLLLRLLQTLEAQHTLMFASDWPHWDFDSPQAIAQMFPADLRQRVMGQTAAELYRF